MDKIATAFKNAFDNFGVSQVLQIILLAVLFAIFVLFLVRNNSWLLVLSFVFYTIMLSAIVILSENKNYSIYVNLIALFIIFIAILYAKEIKRDLWAVKMTSSELKFFKDSKNSSLKSATECIEDIIVSILNHTCFCVFVRQSKVLTEDC